jgi:hypothetical protein
MKSLWGLRDVVSFIIEQCPQSVSAPDLFMGALPLHFCVHQDTQDPSSVEVIIRAFPDGLLCPDGANFLPLHRAAHRKSPDLEVLRLLLKHSPETAKIATSNGNRALHWVCSHQSPSSEAVKIVFEACREIAYTCNEKRKTPIDILKENGAWALNCDVWLSILGANS